MRTGLTPLFYGLASMDINSSNIIRKKRLSAIENNIENPSLHKKISFDL